MIRAIYGTISLKNGTFFGGFCSVPKGVLDGCGIAQRTRKGGAFLALLRKFNAALLKIASWGVILSMAAIAIVIPYEVFGRYVLGNMSTWTGEFSQYALVWASMMGGVVGLKRGYQVGITTLIDRLPPRPARTLQCAGYLFMLFFFILMTYHGIGQMLMNANQTSSTMGIRMSIPYAALPAGFFVMLCVTLEQLLDFLNGAPMRGK